MDGLDTPMPNKIRRLVQTHVRRVRALPELSGAQFVSHVEANSGWSVAAVLRTYLEDSSAPFTHLADRRAPENCVGVWTTADLKQRAYNVLYRALADNRLLLHRDLVTHDADREACATTLVEQLKAFRIGTNRSENPMRSEGATRVTMVLTGKGSGGYDDRLMALLLAVNSLSSGRA